MPHRVVGAAWRLGYAWAIVAPVPFIDTVLFHALNVGAANPVLDAVFPILTSLHQHRWAVALMVLAAVWALWRGGPRGRWWVLLLVLSVGASDAFCSRVIKKVVSRERPCQAVARGDREPAGFPVRVVRPERCPGSQGFPSNHAANMMAAGLTAWWLTRRPWRWAWFLLPLVIGYTRVYLGYHYPSDVVAAWVIGAVMAGVFLLLFRRALARSSAPCVENAGSGG